jgi:hypothetical protein
MCQPYEPNGLAVRVWAIDNNIFPPDIVCMSNELNTPKILVCPPTGRQVAPASPHTDAVLHEYLLGEQTDPPAYCSAVDSRERDVMAAFRGSG